MINNLKIIHYFGAGNYSSTFKLRSRLAQFFKHVHPDQMNQAPPKIRQQNNLSLTNFNSYIDSINQQKPIQGKLLKFYISQKTNHKSKKFFSFSLQLPQINNNDAIMSQEKAEKLVNNIIDVLNKKFKQSQNSKSKTEKHKQKINVQQTVQDIETQQARFKRMTNSIPIHKRKSQYRQQVQDKLKSALNSKYLQSQKDSLAHNLKKSISFADTSTNKSMMWSRLTMKQAGIYKNYQDILDNLIDPRLIYFDQSLSTYQIQQFKKKLLPGSFDRQSFKSSKIISQVCQKMESFDPPICFYVSTFYCGKKIPGFFTVPFNFVATELAKNYENKIDQIVKERQRFQQYHDYHLQLQEKLRKENNIYFKKKQFKGNDDIWSWILMLKRLQKYSFQTKKQIVGLDRQAFSLFQDFYKIKSQSTVIQYKQKFVILIEFQDLDLIKTLEKKKVEMM